MRAVLTDGFTFEVKKFKAVDNGIVLLEDERREEATGFIPSHQIQYVLPDEIADKRGHRLTEESKEPGERAGTVTTQRAPQQPQPNRLMGQQTQTPQIPAAQRQTTPIPAQSQQSQTGQMPPQQPQQPQGAQTSTQQMGAGQQTRGTQTPPPQTETGRQQTGTGQGPTQQRTDEETTTPR